MCIRDRYKNVCGLNPVPDVPGYKKAVIRPQPDVRLGAAKAKVNTAAGYYETGWQYEDNGEVTYTVVIPFDAEAEVYLSLIHILGCMCNVDV